MDRLPPEVICDIFLGALPDPVEGLDQPFQASVSAPLCISHVCRTWRSLALSYGELWSHLCIRCGIYMDEEKWRKKVGVFEAWLERSNGAPLNFAVFCFLNEEDSAEIHRSGQYIITTLISQQCRWRKVIFAWHNVRFAPEVAELKVTDMPMLESLSLSLGVTVLPTICLSRSPRLRKLYLNGKYRLMIGEPSLLHLREPSAVALTFTGNEELANRCADSCVELLRAAPFLPEFHAELLCAAPPRRRSHDVPRIVSCNLHSLKLDYYNEPAFIIDNLTLPGLKALSFDDNVGGDILLDFFQRSIPPLTFLKLHGNFVSEERLLPLLRLLPTIRDLRICDAFVSRRFFIEFSVPSDPEGSLLLVQDQIICPKLETLQLHLLEFLEDPIICTDALIAMLKSRAKLTRRLKTICYDVSVDRSAITDIRDIDNHVSGLQQCFEDGGLVAGAYPLPPAPFTSLL